RGAAVGPVPAGRPAVGWNPDVGAWGRPLPAGGVGSGPAVLAGLGAASQPLATLGDFHPTPKSLACIRKYQTLYILQKNKQLTFYYFINLKILFMIHPSLP